jgi:hypothetical protein
LRNNLLCLACLGIESVVTATQGTVEGSHVSLNLLSVDKYVVTLLRVDSREAVQQAPLQPEGNGCPGLQNGLARFLDIDFLDCLS